MEGKKQGTLWLVGTPIGNLEDITLRALKILKRSDIIFAEDTRRIMKLLIHFDILNKHTFSLNVNNQSKQIPGILRLLNEGKTLSLVSDAGMPVISDPGNELVEACIENGYKVDIVPGPSSVSSAIALSGFPGSHYTFFGFIPRGKNRRRLLRKIADGLYNDSLLVFFDSPYRLKDTLKDWLNIVDDRLCFIARELTKVHQEVYKGTVSRLISHFENDKILGEITVIMSGMREKEED
ncbi:MAG: 16S rRNA (cytidine(1402)-2'-O)-methyltransferase [Kosmotoga sp.]|nr:MAG: 16S rRNA (cytidine(1402)-2'-O)-methyltransferase [Kosmotoga sp.]